MKTKIMAALGAAALAVAVLPNSVMAYWTGGYEVYVNGESIGIVEKAEQVESMLAVVNEQLTDAYGFGAAINPDIKLTAMLVASEKLADARTIHNGLAKASEDMGECVRITVDETATICVANDSEVIGTVKYCTDKLGVENSQTSVVEFIGCMPDMMPKSQILTAQEAGDYLIENGLITVCSQTVEESERKYIPQAVEQEDPELYDGVRRTTYKGRDGVEKVVSVSHYVNGEYTDTTEKSEIIDYGEPAVISVGTKARPAGVGTGSFIMPTSGKITSSYGSRWGRMHNGIDIGASTGTPVYASDDGVVTCSEYKNSYGNLVKIDHGNGYETYYAHNSELLVSVGQTVKKGDLIAKVGSTGNSTGPHCHFEIHYNGETQNPMNYIK